MHDCKQTHYRCQYEDSKGRLCCDFVDPPKFKVGDRVTLKALEGPDVIPGPRPAIDGLVVESVTLHKTPTMRVKFYYRVSARRPGSMVMGEGAERFFDKA